MKPCSNCGSPFFDGVSCPSCYNNSKSLEDFEQEDD